MPGVNRIFEATSQWIEGGNTEAPNASLDPRHFCAEFVQNLHFWMHLSNSVLSGADNPFECAYTQRRFDKLTATESVHTNILHFLVQNTLSGESRLAGPGRAEKLRFL